MSMRMKASSVPEHLRTQYGGFFVIGSGAVKDWKILMLNTTAAQNAELRSNFLFVLNIIT